MEPVTHFLTGACLARAGFNRKAAYATLAMTLAAEAPDLDTLWGIRGPIASFQHHRGWTHTLVGIPFEAALIVAVVWLWHHWRSRSSAHILPLRDNSSPEYLAAGTSARRQRTDLPPARWGLLYLFAIVALFSHILLDWTNNYGVRPFFPFNPRWYAGSFVFIFEPVMFLLLLLGLVAPSVFSLVGSEMGVRRETFRGRGWAIFALVGVVLLWGVRGYERLKAQQLALTGDYGSVPVLRSTVSPYPVTPFRWHAVVETPSFFQIATVDTLTEHIATSGEEDVFHKPAATLAILAAKRSWLGEVYLDWSSFPMVTEQQGGPDPDGLTTVDFRDLRFFYDTVLMHGRSDPPISGSVKINQDRRIVTMELNGHEQH